MFGDSSLGSQCVLRLRIGPEFGVDYASRMDFRCHDDYSKVEIQGWRRDRRCTKVGRDWRPKEEILLDLGSPHMPHR